MTAMARLDSRGFLMAAACGALVLAAGCAANPSPAGAPALSASSPWISTLTNTVPGLTRSQAELSAGALLGLARTRMPASQFAEVAGALPGTEALVDEAVKQGLPPGVHRMSDVTGFLRKSDVFDEQIKWMVPVLTRTVDGKVSPGVAGGFLSALR